MQKAVFPDVTSSHHLHAMAVLAIILAEMNVYGKKHVFRPLRTPAC